MNTGHPSTSWYAATATPFDPLPALDGETTADPVGIDRRMVRDC